MSNSTTNTPRRARWAGPAGLLAAGAIGGGILAGTFSASAATTPSPAPSSGTSTAPSGPADGFGGRHAGGGPGRSDEKVVTGTTAATLRAAALKAVPGGTVDRVETDAGDGAYEAHMTKADGTRVTVKFDSKLAVLRVESGMGTGDPALPGQGAPDAPAAGSSSSSTGSTA